MDQIRLYNNLNYNKKLSRCFLCVGRCRETSRNIANRCGRRIVALRNRGAGAECASCPAIAGVSPEKSSAGPDFLGFALNFDIILKKHMFFDKKYILFSPY